jgi:hypothetical protein
MKVVNVVVFLNAHLVSNLLLLAKSLSFDIGPNEISDSGFFLGLFVLNKWVLIPLIINPRLSLIR